MRATRTNEIGEGNAWLADLYDRYGRTAYGLALRILRDEALAEDAVQEAFLTAWRTASAYRPERSSPKAWILTLTHRRAVDIVRREQYRRTKSEEDAPEAAGATAEESAILLWERKRVVQALDRLRPDERELLELAYYGGLTQAELAERLGVPRGTIKSRTYTALARLRGLLTEPEPVSSLPSGGVHEHAGGDR
jgi:RNA polymerase sigma factor (sigma-70 family)